jgi:hypothetical protein
MRKLLFFLLIVLLNKELLSQETAVCNDGYSKKNILSENYSFGKSRYYNSSPWNNNTPGKYNPQFSSQGIPEPAIASKLYLKLYTGYGFLTPGSYSVQSVNNFTYYDKNGDQHDTTVQSQGSKGIGGGLRLGGGIGYVLNDFLNVGLDAEYLVGNQLSNSLTSSSDSAHFYSTTNDRMLYNAFTISPYIIFKALAKPEYFIYNKLGIVFTLPYTLHASGNSTNSWSYNWHPGISDSSFKSSSRGFSSYDGFYKTSLGIGFNVAFGINFRLSDKLRAFTELFGNFSPLSSSTSNFNTTTNQMDSLYQDNKLSVNNYNEYSTINTTYQDEGLTVSHLVKEADVPGGKSLTYEAQDKKFTINMNVIGINIGIIYRF